MAGLPPGVEERPLKRLARALTLVWAAFPALLAAQTDERTATAVHGYLEVSPRLTRIQGSTSGLLALLAVAGPPGHWRAGGTGVFLLERIEVGTLPVTGLRMGYGGLVVERSSRSAPGDAGGHWAARVTLGGGNADLRDSATGTRVTSDNFLVLEPALLLGSTRWRRLSGGVVAGYRFVIGSNLDDFAEADLSGLSIGMMLRLGPF